MELVLGDDTGRQIDFHVIVFDERGRSLYGPPGTEDHYPAEALTGKGTVPRSARVLAFQFLPSTADSATKDRVLA